MARPFAEAVIDVLELNGTCLPCRHARGASGRGRAGADAIYCGFANETNARNFPGLNFSPEELAEGTAHAHARGARVLVAINTFARAGEVGLWTQAVDDAAACGADAVIAADIAALNREIDVETEVFVFGGLCVMTEGRCALSSYATGKSPNLTGVCSPPDHVDYGEDPAGRLTARLGGFAIDRFEAGQPAGYPTLCKGQFSAMGKTGYLFEDPVSLNAFEVLDDHAESLKFLADLADRCARRLTELARFSARG